MHAVIKTGGKQYRVAEGDVLYRIDPATYNAQIGNRTYAAIKPHVFHIFATFDHDDTIQYHLIRQLKETGTFDQSVIEEFLRTGNPWVRLSSPGQYLALGRPLSAVFTGVRQKLGG